MPFFFRNLLPRRARNRNARSSPAPTILVAAGHLTLSGKDLLLPPTAVLVPGHLTLVGQAIGPNILGPITPGHLTLGGRSVNLSTLVPPTTRAPLMIPSTGNKRATRWRGVPQR